MSFRDAGEVPFRELSEHLKRYIVLPDGVTDVFVWVHGWRNTASDALRSTRRLFNGIQEVWHEHGSYNHLTDFKPAFVAVHWPSWSTPDPLGYRRIRDRARALTENGDAEFFLASLLGYLEAHNVRGSAAGVLRSRGGFYVHCLGHSFGGRFLTAAIRAAATPQSPHTLSLLRRIGRGERNVLSATSETGFEFTVDSALIFQMAAPKRRFGPHLSLLVREAPLSGPLVLTYSHHDRATCLWHRMAELGEAAIGCGGALEPRDEISEIRLAHLEYVYSDDDFRTRIVNVNADWAFRGSIFHPVRAHSDFWYKEAIHLVLSLANYVHR